MYNTIIQIHHVQYIIWYCTIIVMVLVLTIPMIQYTIMQYHHKPPPQKKKKNYNNNKHIKVTMIVFPWIQIKTLFQEHRCELCFSYLKHLLALPFFNIASWSWRSSGILISSLSTFCTRVLSTQSRFPSIPCCIFWTPDITCTILLWCFDSSPTCRRHSTTSGEG